jgi:hypothetical protein
MLIRIEGSDLPGSACGPSPDVEGGYHNIYVGVQRRNRPQEHLELVPGDAASATWTLECDAVLSDTGWDVKGAYIQGPLGGRFIYLSWGTVDNGQAFTMFRRAKLWLEAVPPKVIERASKSGVLVGRLGLTDPRGNPLCASVRPPLIDWSVARP